jgi:hypothetical protein
MKTNIHYLIIFLSVLLKMRNDTESEFREDKKTSFMFNKFFIFENRAVYEIM